MNLSEHFTLAEFTRSETASRRNLDNTPDQDTIGNLIILAQGMEDVRKLLGHPIHINSAYRSPKVNSAVGGSKDSAHMKGFAADFTCPGFGDPWQICNEIIKSDIRVDQLILEYFTVGGGGWTHISFDPQMRGQVLTKLAGQPYRNGLHYS
jgi:hypothetical protein